MSYEKLMKRDNDKIWSKVRKLIDIQLFYSEVNQPEKKGPKSSIIFSVKDQFEKREVDQLKIIFSKAFKQLAGKDEVMYALDWQHDSYRFFPHENWMDMPINMFTEGDYFIFLNESMTEGTFGHPWQNSICFFGSKLCSFIEQNKPTLFNGVVRRNL